MVLLLLLNMNIDKNSFFNMIVSLHSSVGQLGPIHFSSLAAALINSHCMTQWFFFSFLLSI